MFNGNGYDASWVTEAEKRGLLNLRTLPDAMEHYMAAKNVKPYTDLGVYTEEEMQSHYEIKLEKYCQVLNIEVETMLEMINKDILPAAFKYMQAVSKTAIDLKAIVPSAKASAQVALLTKLDGLVNELSEKETVLSKKHIAVEAAGDAMQISKAYVESVIPAMAEARAVADEIEPLLGEEYKPFPSYEDLLFRTRN